MTLTLALRHVCSIVGHFFPAQRNFRGGRKSDFFNRIGYKRAHTLQQTITHFDATMRQADTLGDWFAASRPFPLSAYSARIGRLITGTNREERMLTRRGFASVAGCAICSLAGFSATEAFAQGSAPTTANGITRQILSRTDGPAAGYETIIMDVKIDKGTVVPRHTHPGIESSYVMEGAIEVPVQGQETKVHKAGEAFQIPPETPHAGGKAPDQNVHLMINYIVEKGKPLATPV